MRLRTNYQIQVLSSLFFRNKGAYVVGKIVNGFNETPFALPILHTDDGLLAIDAALFGEDDLQMLFSFARAYFMVDMEIPSAYVQFLRSLMPRKPRSEIYNALGLQKQGKNLFYRDFLYHLRHSSDRFRMAPGIKGMVMLVFDLPSFPFVFKVIMDFYPPQKDTTRELIQQKYRLVKQHDRVGRMADTLEYSNVAFPRQRFEPELIADLKHFCGSLVEESGDALLIRHLYIERRMIPLNIYLHDADKGQIESAVIEYGNAIKDLVAANIFPGDMLFKNFGVTRQGKVVFYDYDEIEYLTDCNFRRVPQARTEEEEMSGEIWYAVGPKDVFPETFGPFLLGNPEVREVFMRHHADLLDAAFWQGHKERILAGHVHDVFPYETSRRFVHQRRRQIGAERGMTGRDAFELASFVVTVIGLPFAIVVFVLQQRKERENEEEEAYQHLSDAYNDFLKIVLANADLHLRTNAALPSPTAEQNERMMVIFDMLISLFERAYLVAYKSEMAETEQRRWNSWDDYMREWCRRDDFFNALPLLLRGEDPEFQRYILRVAQEERGTALVSVS